MGRPIPDLVGKRFGKLVVIERAGNYRGHALWRSKCDCGGTRVSRTVRLTTGRDLACGCTWGNPTHGYTGSPTYSSWQNMLARCLHASNPAFAHYRKRGITVCEKWLTFENFLADMGERPVSTTIDRRDNDGNYEPGNCRWATKQEQANNRFTNIRFDYQGQRFTISELARHTGVSKWLLRDRLVKRQRGQWTVETAVSAPKQRGRRLDFCMSIKT